MSTTWVRRRLSITRARILPATESNEMPRLLPQICLLPFRLKTVTILASFHCCGSLPVVQARWMNWCRCRQRWWPPYLKTSPGIPSGPAAYDEVEKPINDVSVIHSPSYSKRTHTGQTTFLTVIFHSDIQRVLKMHQEYWLVAEHSVNITAYHQSSLRQYDTETH